MKKVTRVGVFETNSSSSHSFSIGKATDKELLPDTDKRGEIHVGIGEYSWEEETYYDTLTKLDYVAIEGQEGKRREMLDGVLEKHYPNVEFIFHDSGYIDLESYDNVWCGIESVQDLENFLFSGESEVTTDNDNH
jgi:uncharacterized protein YdeI (BOF family)